MEGKAGRLGILKRGGESVSGGKRQNLHRFQFQIWSDKNRCCL